MKKILHESWSWLLTFSAEILTGFGTDLLVGAGTFLQSGNFELAAAIAFLTATARTTLKKFLTGVGDKFKSLAK